MTLLPASSGTVGDVRTAIVVLGNGGRRRGSPSITRACLELVREAERIAASQAVDVVVLTGGSRGGPSEAEQMRATSVVSIGYGANTVLGGMGVVGPTRMDYPGTIAAVHAVARYVGEILAGR